MVRVRMLVAGVSLALCSAVAGSATLPLPGVSRPQTVAATWAVRGGEATFMLHAGLSAELGLSMSGAPVRRADVNDAMAIAVDQSSGLEFDADAGMLQRLTGGSLQFRGTLKLSVKGRTLDLSNFVLRPKPGTASDLQLLDGQQKVWLDIDHVHYEALDEHRWLSMRNMDLRVTPAFATWLGDATLTGLAIGQMDIESEIFRSPERVVVPDSCTDPDWPGEPNSNGSGLPSVADVLLESMSSLDYKGCQGTCDGPGGASNGAMKFAPNATLRNSNNPLTADIPWYTKFSGNFPPYGNDQHPYFVWNVYRINQDGQIDQIGRSGTKHAFLTTNTGCAESCGNSHILGPNCGDTYSSGNNESTTSLGPRSEIIPYKAQWGRCGSSYDPNCDGSMDTPAFGAFDNRMMMRESDLEAVSNPGARYFWEGWYVVREDVNIYNTMGYRSFTPSFTSVWAASSPGTFTSGPVLNAWVNHANPAGVAVSREIEVPDNGHMRVAVQARPRATGGWRYDYVVMNFDYAQVETQGSEPNIRLLSSRGVTSFDLALGAGAVTELEAFKDVDADAGNNWAMTKGANTVRWDAPASGNDLSWGTLFRFTVYGGAPASDATATVRSPGGGSWTVNVIGPSGALPPASLFSDGAE